MPCTRSSTPPRAHRPAYRRALAVALGLAAVLGVAPAHAAPPEAPAREAGAAVLPAEVLGALQAAKVPASALAVVVQEAGGGERLGWQPAQPMNPASLFKLLTTYAALDRLGPAWSWSTPVWATGPLKDGVLDGSVHIEGRGDPKLVLERVWLLLRRLQQEGVREIRGDLVLDHGFFAVPGRHPGEFDNEPLRPQNVQPDALLINQKVVEYRFLPEPASLHARVVADPALAGMPDEDTVPLALGDCGDWRGALQPAAEPPGALRFAGRLPAACGPRTWRIAVPDAAGYGARLVARLWRDLGGRVGGAVRDGSVPPGARLLFEWPSPPLAEVVRDINKFSNNVMAEQLFLSLAAPEAAASAVPGAAPGAPGMSSGAASGPGPAAPPVYVRPPPVTQAAARGALLSWLTERLGDDMAAQVVPDNGSGLSRDARVSAAALARLLQHAWASGVMPEMLASLPVSGTDGTLRRFAAAPGRAHLKTGSLRDVAGVAGYVLADDGRRYIVVALINHPQAGTARPALDAVVRWAGSAGAPTPAITACCARRLPRPAAP
ncbi:D-alanyl-D-alanine carboxypeptidase/D-alanyl-D-alanine-endopeptidase [Ideonella sp.]|uniref:D-alanyl-D-alanine carboxypeptidase/D-alanyl-D-alanine-endopeptidase n=1 Tax=Ideonella sp. TaxID=1929293 RepID=UPI0035AF15FD